MTHMGDHVRIFPKNVSRLDSIQTVNKLRVLSCNETSGYTYSEKQITINLFNFFIKKYSNSKYIQVPLLSHCLRPKLSSFKFSPAAFGIFTTPQDLSGAVKVSNLNLHTSKLDTCLIKGYHSPQV